MKIKVINAPKTPATRVDNQGCPWLIEEPNVTHRQTTR
jgi:hypothetical protein